MCASLFVGVFKNRYICCVDATFSSYKRLNCIICFASTVIRRGVTAVLPCYTGTDLVDNAGVLEPPTGMLAQTNKRQNSTLERKHVLGCRDAAVSEGLLGVSKSAVCCKILLRRDVKGPILFRCLHRNKNQVSVSTKEFDDNS